MGGYGSGRWRLSTKTLAENCLSIDINEMNRQSLLKPGLCYTWHWYNDRGNLAGILVDSHSGKLDITYTATRGALSDQINDTIWLSYTTCTFGRRPWFVCPGCGRRSGRLYLKNNLFRCRHCHSLSYQTQRQDRLSRQIIRIQKIRQKLGGDCSLVSTSPAKPKGMHWETYFRLKDTESLLSVEVSVSFIKTVGKTVQERRKNMSL